MSLASWSGQLRRTTSPPHVVADIVIDGPGPTWSAPIKVADGDGNKYFVKTREGCQAGGQSLAIEQVLARAGQLIGASVINPALVFLPQSLSVDVRGVPLSEDFGHGSAAIASCFELKAPPERRTDDDNARRHVGIFALYDWALGTDMQYLYDSDDRYATYSHDHGLYLGGNGRIDEQNLIANVATPGGWPGDPAGLLPASISDVADALEAVDRTQLVSILNLVPTTWPVSDTQLETLGWFLLERAPQVANRLRSI